MDDKTLQNNTPIITLARANSLRVHTNTFTTPHDASAEGKLIVDVYHTAKDIVVQEAVAGVSEENIDIYITNQSVVIQGTRAECAENEEKKYIHEECFWGAFSRTVILPERVDPDTSRVTLKNGILTIRMPKLRTISTKKKRIKKEENKTP